MKVGYFKRVFWSRFQGDEENPTGLRVPVAVIFLLCLTLSPGIGAFGGGGGAGWGSDGGSGGSTAGGDGGLGGDGTGGQSWAKNVSGNGDAGIGGGDGLGGTKVTTPPSSEVSSLPPQPPRGNFGDGGGGAVATFINSLPSSQQERGLLVLESLMLLDAANLTVLSQLEGRVICQEIACLGMEPETIKGLVQTHLNQRRADDENGRRTALAVITFLLGGGGIWTWRWKFARRRSMALIERPSPWVYPSGAGAMATHRREGDA